MKPQTGNRGWRELSLGANQEQDFEKLLVLVHELNETLLHEEEEKFGQKSHRNIWPNALGGTLEEPMRAPHGKV